MPQLKCPDKLYKITLTETRLWIMQHAIQLWRHFGNFRDLRCLQEVCSFNQFLNTCLPSHIVDELYNSTEIFCVSHLGLHKVCICEKQATPDPRIVMSLYINKNMKTLTAHKIVNDCFWKTALVSLEKLTRLDLNKVCTDEILEVVGEHCSNLEFVNIVSKSCHTRRKDRHNALKLQLCVSDIGLDHISRCKRLKEIQMTSIIRKGCGGRQISNEGIKRLLLSLPELKRINYTDTGVLLRMISSEAEKLSLVSLIDFHPDAARIHQINVLCPNLMELDLTYPFSSEGAGSGSEVVSALRASSLKISVLRLSNFSFDDSLKKYLKVKGTYLKVFNFSTSVVDAVDELLRLLGWFCPDLESLVIRMTHIFYEEFNASPCHVDLITSENRKQFCNLKSFIMNGIVLKPNQIFPLVLKNATFIKHIVISNPERPIWLEEPLQLIQQTNTFMHLESISLMMGFDISWPFFKTFVMSCPALQTISVQTTSGEFFGEGCQFRQELLSANYDVNFDVFFVS